MGGVLILLAISMSLNIVLSLTNIAPEPIYRLLSVRYFFLVAVAYIWLHHNDYNKFVLLLLGCLSLVYLWYHNSFNFSPFVYDGDGWTLHNYPGYFFTLVMIVVLLAFAKENKDSKAMKFFTWCGENTWYIFLAQMFVISVFNKDWINTLIINTYISTIVYVLTIFVFSLGSVYLYRNILRLTNK